MKWPNETIIKLIECYKEKQFLWNPTSQKYRNKKARHDAFEEISEKLGIPANELEKKIHSLRTQYHRELRKKNNLNESAWFAFDHFSFLENVRRNYPFPYKHVKGEEDSSYESKFPQRMKQSSYEEIGNDSENNSNNGNDESEHKTSYNPVSKKCCIETSTPSTKLIPAFNGNQVLDDRSINQQINSSQETALNHLDTFGKYVSQELRNIMHDTYSIQVAKHRINEILFQATIGAYKK